jgi:3-dehydroquinate dehydratase/shikimate dehydrogenase
LSPFRPEPGSAVLIASLTVAPPADLSARAAEATWLEVRADLVGDLEPGEIPFSGRRLYTLRSRAEGGAFEGSRAERQERLLWAAERFDAVDLEVARDLVPQILDAVEPERRVLSWHGGVQGAAELKERFAAMEPVPASLYKLVPTASQPGEELAPLLLLASLGRRDVIAFASGLPGVWTRFVAPYLGAPVFYGAAVEPAAAPGQPTIETLRRDFGLPSLPAVEFLCGLVGNPVAHSLSPRLHNGAYRALGIPALYLPFHTESFGDFWLEVVESGVLPGLGLPIRGLSVTSPFKEAALAVAGAESPLASRIGAANTLVRNEGVWEAEATDPEGVVLPLAERRIPVAGIAAAVLGTGGGGRSAAVGLARAGAHVTLVNRTEERGRKASEELGLPFLPLGKLDADRFDLIVNSTSLGRSEGDPLPFDVSRLRPGTVVIDLVYRGSRPTALLSAAAARGALTVDGREVLLFQALGQFRMMTGRHIPVELARELLGLPPESKGRA